MKATVRMICGLISPARGNAAAVLALLAWSTVCLAQTAPEDLEGKVVADVIPQFVGYHSIQAQKVLDLLKTRPEEKYSQITVNEDGRRLDETRWFKYTWPPRAELTRDGKVIVTFMLQEQPSLVREIVYQGAKHFKPDELDSVTGLKRGMPLNPYANKQACQAIVRHYNEKGRMLAQVDLLEGDKPGDSRVVFNITEGRVAKISSIEFTGISFVSAADRKSTRLNSSHIQKSRMPSSA